MRLRLVLVCFSKVIQSLRAFRRAWISGIADWRIKDLCDWLVWWVWWVWLVRIRILIGIWIGIWIRILIGIGMRRIDWLIDKLIDWLIWGLKFWYFFSRFLSFGTTFWWYFDVLESLFCDILVSGDLLGHIWFLGGSRGAEPRYRSHAHSRSVSPFWIIFLMKTSLVVARIERWKLRLQTGPNAHLAMSAVCF